MVTVKVVPGNCNFVTRISVGRADGGRFQVAIETACEQVNRLAEEVRELDLRDLMARQGPSPLVKTAARCGLHASCPIPVGILKAVRWPPALRCPRTW